MKPSPVHNQFGFTLIEVMITVAILAALTVLTAQSLQQAAKSKQKIQDQIDAVSQVRDVQKIIEKDIGLAFHYQDLEEEMAISVQKARLEAKKKKKKPNKDSKPGDVPVAEDESDVPVADGDTSETAKYPPYFKPENRISPKTQFQGKEQEINFVTQHVIRAQKDMPIADFGEVGYFLESCKGSGPQEGKCLFRRFSPFVDKDVTRGGSKTQLLRHVKELKFKYFSKKKKDWANDFNSDSNGESFSVGRYPEAVEVTLQVEAPVSANSDKTKKIGLQFIVPIRNPNNESHAMTESKEPSDPAENDEAEGVPLEE